ncbi:hypothetical protein [Alicyclobacillus dauci]|uniref:Ribbon-helix-helix protein, copG family n=1 Tax=Alicyclobacillus dauci TaxID=1475485 RepID=A0ABY6Z1Z9_9BACL|nr:hypothetical protein [Alicyclobacillus dauci]WAH36712.1 hypothetical protein NZD86_21475 [Alicyclobacillus dauci]
MSDLKGKLQQRLIRSRSVHQELIQPISDEQGTTAESHPKVEANPSPGPGRPRKLKRKVTTLYFDEDLDKALELFLMRQYIETGTKTSKSEWIRRLVETSLRDHNAWPLQS